MYARCGYDYVRYGKCIPGVTMIMPGMVLKLGVVRLYQVELNQA